MNVLLVSQCNKRALAESRRILDQFAERRGERTWQTPITQIGLDTLRKLLRKTARKNTAVACHWIRGQGHSELLWIVGNARRFNAEGAVPTNVTMRNVLRHGDENDWHNGQDIRLLAQLAALLHDLGKASIAFQQRLLGKRLERNLYRHEWVSLRLFQAFVGDDDDTMWLTRLAEARHADEQVWTTPGRYQRDGLDAKDPRPFRQLPPLAAAIGWLVVTHHRLPVVPARDTDGRRLWLGMRVSRHEQAWLESPLAQVGHDWNEVRQSASPEDTLPYWQFAGPLPVIEPTWRAHAARLAKKLLERGMPHMADWRANPYVMHLARLSLMLADHHYSSLSPDAPQRAKGDGNTRLFANTDKQGHLKQPLDEHLIGVARDAGFIAHALPGFERYLPRLANHRGLRKRSADSRFAWQDKAFDAATAMRESARERGAFIVNMASTGCGKTIANARILYALADPQLGLRATYALGLRTLTLQTGHSYRRDLHLHDDELAVHVGGSASRTLFEYNEEQAESRGSASTQALIEEDSHVLFDGNTTDHPLLSRALADVQIKKLLSAPMLVCTVDHLTPATESLRAGRQIAPMLRLMSADLVLDELDDYDLDDLPALTRLVHWAGMLGTRVVLSSATLPPALLEGMFAAYRAGRRHYRANRGPPGSAAMEADIPCLWVDEFDAKPQGCHAQSDFAAGHAEFVARRVRKLKSAPVLRRAELLPLAIRERQPEQIRTAFAQHVRAACLRLHNAHANRDTQSGQRVSFGLVRMANIDPIFDVARELYAQGAPEGFRIHLCVYHARFPLMQRSAVEYMLDAVFDRRQEHAVWQLPQVRRAIDAHPESQHLFVVLASPVCELGRDWDVDWAVAEPSSMRSLIQLAGRVQRHRRKPCNVPNVFVFDTNLRHIEQPALRSPFSRPGFEKETQDGRFLFSAHSLQQLLTEDEYRELDAVPRIQPRPADTRQPQHNFVDLEHARVEAASRPQPTPTLTSRRRSQSTVSRLDRDQAAAAWQYPQAALIGVLPQQQPFRENRERSTTLALLPDEDEEHLNWHRVESVKRGSDIYVSASDLMTTVKLVLGAGIEQWGGVDLLQRLAEHAEALDQPLPVAARKLATVEVPSNDQGWRWHPWLGITRKR